MLATTRKLTEQCQSAAIIEPSLTDPASADSGLLTAALTGVTQTLTELRKQAASRAETLTEKKKELVELEASAELTKSWTQIESLVRDAKQADRLTLLAKPMPGLLRTVTGLAKTASDLDKPRGFSVIGREDALAFLEPRSVGTLPGVGPAGATALERNGLKKIGDIRAVGPQRMRALYGDWGAHLFALSMADDPRKVDPHGERKSISSETTFFEDVSEIEALEDILWPLCEKVAARCRASETAGLTLTLKLKDTKFKIITRRRQLPEPTLLASRIFAAARELLAGDADGKTKYRLIGVGLSDFSDAAAADKGDMLDTDTPKRAAVEAAIAKAREKFGRDAVLTGRGFKVNRDDAEEIEGDED